MVDLTKPIFTEGQFKEYISVLEKALSSINRSNSAGVGPIRFSMTSKEMVNSLNYAIQLYPELEKIGNDRLMKMKVIGISPIKIINPADGDSYCSKTYPAGHLVPDKEINQAIDILTTYATVRTWQDK
ncbi:MAG: hypothetical protein AABY15_09030, partial [Nanoarchaeota archaeon]